MSTNDIIIGAVNRGSFRFPIEFTLFDNSQYIQDATFDTGCSHSLISAKNLNLGGKSVQELKEEAQQKYFLIRNEYTYWQRKILRLSISFKRPSSFITMNLVFL